MSGARVRCWRVEKLAGSPQDFRTVGRWSLKLVKQNLNIPPTEYFSTIESEQNKTNYNLLKHF